jgi:hypothetical protein
MRALSTAELLTVWERGISQPPAHRAVTLLAPVCADALPHELAQLPIGRRDARLLALREQTFGPRLLSLSECPKCGARVELEFDVADVRAKTEIGAAETAAPITLRRNNFAVTFRLPNTLDLAAAAEAGNPSGARQRLLERCVLSALDAKGGEVPPTALPEELLTAVAARMSEADPQADVQLAIVCPQCHHQWNASFDIAGFFWTELHACAQRLLGEIHELASAYGWREADIQNLSAARRQVYLELVRA